MRYARIIDGKLEKLNTAFIKYNGRVYTDPVNNPNIDILSLGYKVVVYDLIPEYDEDTQYVKTTYTETEKQILVSYDIINIDSEEELEEVEEEIVEDEEAATVKSNTNVLD